MKMTWLEIVQDILNSLDDLEVNALTDSVESVQVAGIVRSTYYELIDRKEWTHLSKIRKMDSVSDSTKPNYLKLPSGTVRVDWLKYDSSGSPGGKKDFKEIKFLFPDDFLQKANNLDNTKTNVDEVEDYTGVSFFCYNDRAPSYYTSFDDTYIVFDAYDSNRESTLQGNNTQSKIYAIPDWPDTYDDDFIPDLPAEAFSLLVSEAKSMAFFELNQMIHEKAEANSRRHSAIMSQRGRSVRPLIRFPNFGRRSVKTSRRHTNLLRKD